MDLYADLPLAKGEAAADGNAPPSSTVWAKGVTGFVPGQRQAPPPPVATSVSMLPSSLASSRAKSPNAPAAARPAGRGRGVSLAFRPASLRKMATAPPPTTARANAFAPSHATPREAAVPVEAAPPRGGLGFVAATTWTQVTVPKEEDAPSEASETAATPTHFFQATYRDEYHPSRPNSYEAFCEERTAKKKLEQVKRELEERQREQERESKREREQFAKAVSEGKAPAIALPTSAGRGRGMTVPAWMRKKIEENAAQAPAQHVPGSSVLSDTEHDQFDDAAPRGGLGFSSTPAEPARDEFGREIPTRGDRDSHRSERDSREGSSHGRSGRHSRSRSRDRDRRGSPSSSRSNRSVRAGPSSRWQGSEAPRQPRPGRVILLQNMVGPGEVDDELEKEVKEECTTKYGPVEKCVVFEVRGRVSAEEAVRIFVQFRNQAHADQALNGLNGRFFGGRRVKATYYDEECFARREYSG